MFSASCAGTRHVDSGWRDYVRDDLYREAEEHRAAGEPAEARRALQRLRREDPSNLAAILGEIELTENADDRAALSADLDALIRASGAPERRASYIALQSALDPDELRREDTLRAALNLDPKNSLVHAMLARLLDERADSANAGYHWDVAAGGESPPPFALRAVAANLAGSHSRKDAIAALEAYLEIVPDDSEAAFNLGTLYLEDDWPDRAYRWLEKAHEDEQHDVATVLNFSTAAILTGRLEKAEELLGEARRLSPDDPEIVFNLAVLYADHLKSPDQAVTAFEEYLTMGGEETRRVERWLAELRGEQP